VTGPTLTAAQLATLEALIRDRGRAATAAALHSTTTALDTIEIGRARPRTVARLAAALDEIARAHDVAPAVGEGHCGDTQRGCWRPGQVACVCRCVRCGP